MRSRSSKNQCVIGNSVKRGKPCPAKKNIKKRKLNFNTFSENIGIILWQIIIGTSRPTRKPIQTLFVLWQLILFWNISNFFLKRKGKVIRMSKQSNRQKKTTISRQETTVLSLIEILKEEELIYYAKM